MSAIQQALKDKGHDPGNIDGLMGPRTRTALRDFQTAQGMEPTGRSDAKTLAALGVEAKTDGAGSSSPSSSPGTGGGGTGTDKK
ncbi:MAG: peptidoglycan-binding domain-containing protein [Candidatus Rokuibacteriota bacterium]